MNKKVSIKPLLILTIPIFLELALQILVGNVDKVMVQNDMFADAINQANTILDMLVVSLSVLSSASLILISQYKGAKDVEKEKAIYKISFYFNLLIGIIISLIIFIFAKPIFKVMQVNEEVMPYALNYIRITGGFIFLQAMMLSLASYLRSNNFLITSLIISLVFNIINIFLNAFFLYIIKLEGITAVAVASTISRFIGFIILFVVCKRKIKLNLSIKNLFPIKKKELNKILSIGLPSCGESISYSLSQIVILAIINIIGNTLASGAPAAKSYASMIATITYLFVSAISQGMQIILGRYLGSNQKEEAKELIIKTTIISTIVSIITAIIIALISKPLFSLLTKNPEIIDLCVKIMYIEIALEFGRAINIVMVRALQTAGDVMFPTILAIIFCWIVATLGGYILGVKMEYGILGVWIAMAVDEIIRAIIFLFRFKQGKWQTLNLT